MLFAVVGVGLGTSREEAAAWLRGEGLWGYLSPSERHLFDAASPTEKQLMNASWRSEALLVLAWALGKIATVPPASEQCDTAVFQRILPPFANISVREFIASASLREESELRAMAASILELHWQVRDGALRRRETPHADVEIVQERHHAINWICGYEGLVGWDDVTTDT